MLSNDKSRRTLLQIIILNITKDNIDGMIETTNLFNRMYNENIIFNFDNNSVLPCFLQNNSSILHLISFYRSKACFNYLVENNYDLSAKDGKGNNFMHFALLSGWFEIVFAEEFTEYISVTQYPLHDAASSGDLDCFKYVYDRYRSEDAIICSRNSENQTIANICILNNYFELIEFLKTEKLLEINTENLHCCTISNNINLFIYIFQLLDNYDPSSYFPDTDIACAIEKDSISIVKIIFQRCAFSTDDFRRFLTLAIKNHSNQCALYFENVTSVTEEHLITATIFKNVELINYYVNSFDFPTLTGFVEDLRYIFKCPESSQNDITYPNFVLTLCQKFIQFAQQLLYNNPITDKCFSIFHSYLSSMILNKDMTKINRIIIKIIEYLLGAITILDLLSIISEYYENMSIIKFCLSFRTEIRVIETIQAQKTNIWNDQDVIRFWIGYLTFSTNTKLISAVVSTKTVNQCKLHLINLFTTYSNTWEATDDALLYYLKEKNFSWIEIASKIISKTNSQCRQRYNVLKSIKYQALVSDNDTISHNKECDKVFSNEPTIAIENSLEKPDMIEEFDTGLIKADIVDPINDDKEQSTFKGLLMNLSKELKKIKHINHHLAIENSKLKKENESLKNELLKQKEFINLQNEDSVSSHILREMISNHLRNKYHRIYDEQILNFSYVIHSISPAAFLFIRSFLALPSAKTIEIKFKSRKSEFNECLQDVDKIPTIVDVIKSRYLDDFVNVDATISIDAFAIEVFKENNHDSFIFDCLPISGYFNTFPLHFEFTKHGKANKHIDDILIKIGLILEKCSIYPRFIATDGDSFWQYRHDIVFKEIKSRYKSGDIEYIINYVRSVKMFPLTDFLHFLKNMRNKIVNHTMSLSHTSLDHLITASILNEVIDIGPPLTDNRYSSKMLDRYPLLIFTLKNLLICLEKGNYDCFIYMFPYTMWNIAMTASQINENSRKTIFLLAFHSLMLFDQMIEDKGIDDIKFIYSNDSLATFILKPSDIARVANTIAGKISILGLPIKNKALNRLTSHPTENHIGTIRVGSYYYHTTQNLLNVSVKGTLNHQCQQQLGIDPHINKRANIAGQKLDETKDSIDVVLPISTKEVVKALFKKVNLIPDDNIEDTNECFKVLKEYLQNLNTIFNIDRTQKSETQKSMCAVSNIIARLVSEGSRKIKEKNKLMSNGELKLIIYLRNKGLSIENISKYLPGRSIDSIIRTLAEPEQITYLENAKMAKIIVGIPNLGNTCYIASTLQILLNNQILYQFIMSQRCDPETLLSEIQVFIASVQQSSLRINDDFQRLIESLDYNIFQQNKIEIHSQNEVPELLLNIINCIALDMSKTQQKAFFKIFEGETIDLITCEMSHEVYQTTRFIFLTLHFRSNNSNDTYEFEDLVSSFENIETIENCMCDNCVGKVKMKKQSFISKLPEVLFVHISRFTNDLQKNLNSVHFSSTSFQISDRLGHTEVYVLNSAIVHFGNSITTGHYKALEFDDTVCRIYDDSIVTNTDTNLMINDNIFKSNVYFLVYNKIKC